MPEFSFPETIDIPFDTLTAQQRLSIKLLMEGAGLQNPQKEKIDKTKELVDEEKTLVEDIEELTEQQKSDILILLDKLQVSLEEFGIHTDKISGVGDGDLTEFFDRLSVTAMYTRVMKSITGIEEERYSTIFSSILDVGDKCLGNISTTTTCNNMVKEGTCSGIVSGSGIQGLAEQIKTNPAIVYDVVHCHLPTIIECLDNTIVDEEIQLCEAKKAIEAYSAGSRVIGDTSSDLIFNEVIQQIVASSELKQHLLDIAV